jgi:hypothetical protein
MDLKSALMASLRTVSKVLIHINMRETINTDSILISDIRMDQLISMY